jgi:hypothetical protein
MTSYVAEFINTGSNLILQQVSSLPVDSYFRYLMRLVTVYLGIRGITDTKRHGNGRDKVTIRCYAMLALVGVGSVAYHTNIKYWAQICTLTHPIKQ